MLRGVAEDSLDVPSFLRRSPHYIHNSAQVAR